MSWRAALGAMAGGAWVALALVALGCTPGAGPNRGVDVSESGSREHARRAGCTLAHAGCHDVEDCQGRGICEAAPPTSDPGCGIPPRRVEECADDDDCDPGQVCNEFLFGCDKGHRCEARCETAGCPQGWACRADGRCTARLCPGEWDCGDYGECKPRAPGDGPLSGGRDWHACVPYACQDDTDCPCAHCVGGRCSPIPGRCIEPRG